MGYDVPLMTMLHDDIFEPRNIQGSSRDQIKR
jgi:hypothetical protein